MSAEGPGPGATVTGLVDARRTLGMSVPALWIGYISVGGNGSLAEVKDWLAGHGVLPGLDHDMLAQALNDRFTEAGLEHRVAYSRE